MTVAHIVRRYAYPPEDDEGFTDTAVERKARREIHPKEFLGRRGYYPLSDMGLEETEEGLKHDENLGPPEPQHMQGGGAPEPFEANYPEPKTNMISDEELAQAKIDAEAAKKYGPREGGLMQTVPQFAGLIQTPEGRSQLAEGARRWWTGDREGKETGWTGPIEKNPFVEPIIETVKGPHKALTEGMTPEEQTQWGFGTASNLIGAGTFAAMRRPAGDIGIFGGRGAHGAPTRRINEAEAARAADIDEGRIWDQHEIAWDKSGNVMFEIPTREIHIDSQFPRHQSDPNLLAFPQGLGAKLVDILKGPDADKLFRYYPHFRDILIFTEDYDMNHGIGASTYIGQNKISISPVTPDKFREILFHELQHKVQEFEGWPGGSNPILFLPSRLRNNWSGIQTALQNQADWFGNLLGHNGIDMEAAFEAFSKQRTNPNAMTRADRRHVEQVRRVLGDREADLYNEFVQVAEELQSHWTNAVLEYQKVFGEALARASQHRRDFTSEQRRWETPQETFAGMQDAPVPWEETVTSPVPPGVAPYHRNVVFPDRVFDRWRSEGADNIRRRPANVEISETFKEAKGDRQRLESWGREQAEDLLQTHGEDARAIAFALEKIRSDLAVANSRGSVPNERLGDRAYNAILDQLPDIARGEILAWGDKVIDYADAREAELGRPLTRQELTQLHDPSDPHGVLRDPLQQIPWPEPTSYPFNVQTMADNLVQYHGDRFHNIANWLESLKQTRGLGVAQEVYSRLPLQYRRAVKTHDAHGWMPEPGGTKAERANIPAPFTKPEEARGWLEHSFKRNPVETWGYSNQQDYVRLANELSGRMESREAWRQYEIDTLAQAVSEPDIDIGKFENKSPAEAARLLNQAYHGNAQSIDTILDRISNKDPGFANYIFDRLPREVRDRINEHRDSLAQRELDDWAGSLELIDDAESAGQVLNDTIARGNLNDLVSNFAAQPVSSYPDAPPPQPPAGQTLRQRPPVVPSIVTSGKLNFASSQFMDYFNNIIQPKVGSLNTFVDKFFGGQNTSDIRADIVQDYYHHGGNGVMFQGNVLTHDSPPKVIGRITRSVYPETKFAEHISFAVDDQFKGSGVPAKILQGQIEQYKKMGIERVGLSTGYQSGALTWLRYGWLPDRLQWENMRRIMKNEVDPSVGDPKVKISDPDIKKLLMKILDDPDVHAAWDLSDFRYKDDFGNELAPVLLLGHSMRGIKGYNHVYLEKNDWSGSLNLTSAASMQRFNAYAGRKNKTGN